MRTVTTLALLIALASPAAAAELVTFENDAANVSVQLTLAEAQCIDGVEPAANFAVGSGATLQIAPVQRPTEECAWARTTQAGAWQVIVRATRDDGSSTVLGWVGGNGTNAVKWTPAQQDSAYLVLPIERTVGTLQLSVIQTRTTVEDRAVLANNAP